MLGGGVDTVQSSLTYALGDELENLTLTGIDAIDGTGNALANTITGNDAANTLDGGLGLDTLIGAGGDDTYIINDADLVVEVLGGGVDLVLSSISYALTDEVENLTLVGVDPINGTGNALANTITGNDAANTLDGGLGLDTLIGAGGDDTYVINDADLVVEALAGGVDLVLSSISYALTDEVENLTLTGVDAINGTGNALANTITGNDAANTLDGGDGLDTLIGAGGNDTYIINDADLVVEVLGGGVDLVLSSISYALTDEVENLTLTGVAAIDGTGNALANTITGNGAANLLSGDAGNDTLVGGAGNDTLVGGAGLDTLNGGADVDTADYSAETDNLFITIPGNMRRGSAAAAIEDTLFAIENVIGGAGADSITGSGAANVLTGGLGGDTLLGAGGDDTLDGGDGDDTLRGGLGADTILGGVGNDTITYIIGEGADAVDGGADADALTLIGTGAGDTLDVVYDGAALTTFEGGTLVNIEAVIAAMGGGVDTLSYAGSLAGVTVNLGAGAASGFASVSSVENVVGGLGGDTLTGNAANNVLSGGDGADTLVGGAGADTLNGGAGADTISGGIGADVIDAGAGDDTINYQFGDGVDTLDGGADSDTFVITANAGNNTLNVVYNGSVITSAAGLTLTNIELVNADLLGGVDTLSFTSSASAVSANLGAGTASGFGTIAGIENLVGGQGGDTLTGDGGANNINGGAGAGADTLDGAGGADTLIGGAGADILIGGAGSDVMNGGNDNDTFVFSAGFGNDTINVFDPNAGGGGQDLLDISALGINAANFAARVVITDLGNDTLLTIDGVDTITLIGVNGNGANVITQADFILGGP